MRWVICPVIGSGTSFDEVLGTADDPYRAKVADYGSHAAVIPGNADGTPVNAWALVYYDGDTSLVEADSECVMLPDLAREEVVTSDLIPIGKGTVDMPNLFAWVGLTMEENVEGFGQQLDSTFTYDSMRVG